MHECFRTINKALEDKNAELDLQQGFNLATGKPTQPRLAVPLRKLDSKKRKSLPVLIVKFCPFCGASM